MFAKSSEAKSVNMLKGITRRTLTYGNSMLLVEFHLEAGAVLPMHDHPYEQIGYLCRGSGKMWIGEEAFEILPGSSWCVPKGIPHRAEFYEDSVAIDVFYPVRKDYL